MSVFLTFLSRQFFKEISLKESRWPINNGRHGFKSRLLQNGPNYISILGSKVRPLFLRRRIFPARGPGSIRDLSARASEH